ncbi:DUF4145 domain-containing protein [Stenotrophomonas pavanii]|uniref:DUF4145 domain-containing protein n=1 Tax=Stenotrophomonas pavanii TaxID=487698 RepID=UPI000CCFED01|nr:DUF4145 domain-containing protein [Stenotrophomonas pavanii]PNY74498.1 hypothetical protein C1750_07385 [Stenotrophomonas pavanii]
MSEITHSCPRCGTPHTTFDVKGFNWRYENYGWQNGYEVFSVCRSCRRGSILVVEEKSHVAGRHMETLGGISKMAGVLNHFVDVVGVINIKDVAAVAPPDHLPPAIEAAFSEGASCLAINCVNAAAAMFRLCVDLATVELVPSPDQGGPSPKVARDLGLRLPWLFANGKLPQDLLDLSVCIKDDGNDGVHRGSLSSEEAEDLLDFTVELLRRLYTEKERVRLARERKDARPR